MACRLSGERGAIACLSEAGPRTNLTSTQWRTLASIASTPPLETRTKPALGMHRSGPPAVARPSEAWIEAVEEAILRVVPDAADRWPNHEEHG